MKKILISMMTIAMVSAMIGGGIYAAFNDTENGGSSAFSSGTVDLTLNGGSDTGVALFGVYNWDGTALDNSSTLVKNIGSLDATLGIDFGVVANTESTGTTGTATGGSSTTMIDSSLIGGGNDYWVGYKLYMLTGNADTEVKTVTGFDSATGTVTVGSVWTGGNVAAGDTYALATEAERDSVNTTYGELGFIKMAVWIDVDGDDTFDAEDRYLNPNTEALETSLILNTYGLADYSGDSFTGFTLDANTEVNLVIDWNGATGSNDAEGDSLSVTINFGLST